MREVVSVHVGSTGIGIGNKTWQLFATEQFVDLGREFVKRVQRLVESNLTAFYGEWNGAWTPRALFVDSDPGLASNLTFHGSWLIGPDQIVQTSESGESFTAGESLGRLHNDQIQESIRKLIEPCSTFQGFFIYNSISGGLSGLSSHMIENFSDFYSKSTKVGITVFPSSTSDDLATYNSVLSFNSYLSKLDSCFYLENEAIQRVYKSVLDINSVTKDDINMMIASLVSQITSSLRFEDGNEMSIRNFVSDYIPYPPAKYLVASMAPVLNRNSEEQDKVNPCDACLAAYSDEYLFSNTSLKEGKLIAGHIFYRGNIGPKDICLAASNLRITKNLQFADWTTSGIRSRISHAQLNGFRDSLFLKSGKEVCFVCNTTAMKRNFSEIKEKFDAAWGRGFRGTGNDEGGLMQGREGLETLVQDYFEMELESEVQEKSIFNK